MMLTTGLCTPYHCSKDFQLQTDFSEQAQPQTAQTAPSI